MRPSVNRCRVARTDRIEGRWFPEHRNVAEVARQALGTVRSAIRAVVKNKDVCIRERDANARQDVGDCRAERGGRDNDESALGARRDVSHPTDPVHQRTLAAIDRGGHLISPSSVAPYETRGHRCLA